jgi:hypothetical protein
MRARVMMDKAISEMLRSSGGEDPLGTLMKLDDMGGDFANNMFALFRASAILSEGVEQLVAATGMDPEDAKKELIRQVEARAAALPEFERETAVARVQRAAAFFRYGPPPLEDPTPEETP